MSTDLSLPAPSEDGSPSPASLAEQATLIAAQLIEVGKLGEQVSELKTELDDYLERGEKGTQLVSRAAGLSPDEPLRSGC